MVGCERVGGGSDPHGKSLPMSQPGVAYTVRKDERIVRDKNLQMTVQLLSYKWTSPISTSAN